MTPNQAGYQAWHLHQTLPHGQRPTRKHLTVFRLLTRWQHRMPAHAKLARAAGCCVRTVQNALNRFRGLGLLSWCHQGAQMRSGRTLQLPNRYWFTATKLSFCPFRYVGKLGPQPPLRTVAQQLRIIAIG
jgi:hypothetical protein